MSDKQANQVMTNADRVRSMSNKELAEWHENLCPGDMTLMDCEGGNSVKCEQCWLDWLNSPAESAK